MSVPKSKHTGKAGSLLPEIVNHSYQNDYSNILDYVPHDTRGSEKVGRPS